MNEREFLDMADLLEKYLAKQKVFIQNPRRMQDVSLAFNAAQQLFPEAEISIVDDPLQMGAVIITIEDFDLTIRDIEKFTEVVHTADNFEIYAVSEDKVRIAILFHGALIKIHQQ